MIDTIQLWKLFELLLALAVWPFLMGIFLIVGSRQSREGQGTARRLYWVSLVAATLGSLPMLIWLVVLLPPYSVESSFSLALSATAMSAVWTGGYVRRLMRGPFTTRLANQEMPEMERMLERLGEKPTAMQSLVAENGSVLPGWLMGDSKRLNAYLPDDDSSEGEKSRSLLFPLVIAYAPGECWWQMALVPMAAVSATCAAAFVGEYMAIAVAVLVFAVAKCLVNWSFRRGRGEGTEHYFV